MQNIENGAMLPHMSYVHTPNYFPSSFQAVRGFSQISTNSSFSISFSENVETDQKGKYKEDITWMKYLHYIDASLMSNIIWERSDNTLK